MNVARSFSPHRILRIQPELKQVLIPRHSLPHMHSTGATTRCHSVPLHCPPPFFNIRPQCHSVPLRSTLSHPPLFSFYPHRHSVPLRSAPPTPPQAPPSANYMFQSTFKIGYDYYYSDYDYIYEYDAGCGGNGTTTTTKTTKRS